MRFFRRRPRLALVALLALATQAYMSFGHTHEHAHRVSDVVAMRALGPVGCSSAAASVCGQPAPNDSDANCAICWTMALAATLVLAESPSVSFQPPPSSSPGPLRLVAGPPSNKTVQFQARAPPLALSA
jgi:hypothetical protein